MNKKCKWFCFLTYVGRSTAGSLLSLLGHPRKWFQIDFGCSCRSWEDRCAHTPNGITFKKKENSIIIHKNKTLSLCLSGESWLDNEWMHKRYVWASIKGRRRGGWKRKWKQKETINARVIIDILQSPSFFFFLSLLQKKERKKLYSPSLFLFGFLFSPYGLTSATNGSVVSYILISETLMILYTKYSMIITVVIIIIIAGDS